MANEKAPIIRRRVTFSGRVQGVFFRATSAEMAREMKLAGYVRNLSNGDVELEAQGTPEQIETLLRAVSEHYGRNITGRQAADVAVVANERSFDIRY
ncbi:Acylphosphatase [Phycisphaerae bacterium RAS1]|nr:Acylphosphatase [Phycisphaerae bacterium RAS1]